LTTKTHQLVDGHGKPLVTVCTAGQDGDSPMLPFLLQGLSVPRQGPGRPRTKPDAVLADKAYSSKAHRELLRSRKITAVIPEREDQKRHRKNRGPAGGRPPGFDAQVYKGRNVVERGFSVLKQWRGIATRYDKLHETYRAAVVLHGVVSWLKELTDTP
jgi:transposase